MNVRRATLGAVGLAAALITVSGCGIRPTAVPVDAGAPASRTACPSPVRVPEAVVTPVAPQATPQAGASAGISALPKPVGPTPTVPGPSGPAAKTPAVTSAPSKTPNSLFSAVPSPTASASHCP